jgi:hypothetical protein
LFCRVLSIIVVETICLLIAMQWNPELKHHCPETPRVLVGLKTDLREDEGVLASLREAQQQPISVADAEQFANKIGAVTYVECSALTQKGLKEVYWFCVQLLVIGQPHNDEQHQQMLIFAKLYRCLTLLHERRAMQSTQRPAAHWTPAKAVRMRAAAAAAKMRAMLAPPRARRRRRRASACSCNKLPLY